MRKLIRAVFLFLFFTTAVVACNTTEEECKEDCKKECCEKEDKAECDDDCEKPCCSEKESTSDSSAVETDSSATLRGDEEAHTCTKECAENPDGCPHHS
jgi:hypothetical protein